MAFSGDVILNFVGGYFFKMQGPNSKNTRTNLKQQARNNQQSTTKSNKQESARQNKNFSEVFLMDEILHHLGWLKPYK